MKLKYVFLTGLPTPKDSPFLRRKVTVTARYYMEAERKARAELNRRCEEAEVDPPVGWDLELIEATPPKRRIRSIRIRLA